MQREERVITDACVNVIVPLATLGLFANFIPYLLLVIPFDNHDVCWFYYVSRSPAQINYVTEWMYWMGVGSHYFYTLLEIAVLIYYLKSIGKMKMGQINIAKESWYVTFTWFLLTVLGSLTRLVQFQFHGGHKQGFQLIVFGIEMIRDF